MKKLFLLLFGLVVLLPATASDYFNRWVNLSAEVNAQPVDNLYPEYALSGNTIHMLWVETKYNETANLYYRRSTDNGKTWENPKLLFSLVEKINLAVKTGFSRVLSVEGNNVHIAFVDYEYSNNGTGRLYYMNSTDGGTNFSSAKELANTGGGYSKYNASFIKCTGNHVAVAYEPVDYNNNSKGIHVAYSTNNGASFTDTTVIAQGQYNSHLVDFAYDGTQMVLLHNYTYWYYGLNTGKVYASVSNDNGANFVTHKLSRAYETEYGERERAICNPISVSFYHYTPHIAVSGSYIHVVFEEIRFNASGKETYRSAYARSTNKGQSFEDLIDFTETENGTPPTIVSKGDKVYIAMRNAENNNIYLKTSHDNGANFTTAVNHFKERYPSYLKKPDRYQLLIDPSDANGSTLHIVGDRHTLATSTDGGQTFPYFMTSNRNEKTALMFSDLLLGADGVKHFFLNLATKYQAPYEIYYHKVGVEPEPDAVNHAFRVKEANGSWADDTPLLIPASSSLKFTSALTAEMWVKFNPELSSSAPLIVRNKESYFLDKTSNGFHLSANIYDKKLMFYAGLQTDNGRFYLETPREITDTLWHHVAMTYDANGGLNNFRIYLDGVVKNTETVIGQVDAGDGVIALGGFANSNWEFNYHLDEVRLWDKALTREELRQNMTRKDFVNEVGLKLYLNFDNTLKDISGNGNDALTMGILEMQKSDFNPPIADFDLYKNMSEVSLNDKTQNGAVIKWDFGNKVTSTQTNPRYKYPQAGEYEITMTAGNKNSVMTASKLVSITGLDRVSPVKAGNRGNLRLDVYGGGLTAANTTILLRKTGQSDIAGEAPIGVNSGYLQTKITLEGAATGVWDVVVKKGATEQVLPAAFTVEEAKEAIPWVNIAGREAVLLNRFQTYTINYGNRGNMDAYSVPLWLVVSNHENLEVEYLDFEMVLPDYFENHENAALIKEVVGEFFVTDMIDGVSMDARVYPLLIPVIRANTAGSLRIRVKSSEDYELKATIQGAWVENSADNSQLSPSGNAAMYAMSSNLTKAECLVDILGRGVIDQTLSLVPGYDCLSNGISIGRTAFSFATGSSKQSFWNAAWNIGLSAVNCGTSLIKDAAFPLKFGMFAVNMLNTAYDMKQCLEPSDEDDKKVRAVSSFDPNEMIGPNGFGDENWMQFVSEIPYTILFENMSSATAPAHEVFIADTLDVTKFDLTNFSFGAYGWGDTLINQSAENVREFTREIDLRPGKNTIVRVSGSVDESRGVVKWNFVSLDPETMDYHEDPFLGFLPPNNEKQVGEGFVSFTVGLKPVTQTGTVVRNKANIVFDANAPILTNEYVNTFDLSTPQSAVVNVQADDNGDILVSWTGQDEGAGIRDYTIWVQQDDEEIKPLFIRNTELSGKFKGKSGASYKFYSIATDNTNREEDKAGRFDYQYSFTNVAHNQQETAWSSYPNPVKDKLLIDLKNFNTIVQLHISDVSGRTMYRSEYQNAQLLEVDLSVFTAGIYFVKVKGDTKSAVMKIVKE